MQAIILAAGMGKRLKDLTKDNTKCMIKVNGITLIERLLAQLDRLMLTRIILVVGYEKQNLIDFISTLNIKTPIIFLENTIYDRTNNIYSLAIAKKYLIEDDTLLLESDLIFQEGILRDLVDDPRSTLALVDKYASWMDGTVVKIDNEDKIVAFVPGEKFVFEDIPFYYKTVNIYKFSKSFSKTCYVPFLEAYSMALGDNEYYEQVLRVITMLDYPNVRAKRLSGQIWYEIDDIQDLDIAESMFSTSDEEKLAMLQDRYGGYWRYPKLKDFCYLVNPYYPPQRLIDEIKANFEMLLTQYPSGLRVNTLLAAKYFNVRQEYIIVGNGASELIKVIMESADGKIGFVRPTFEEYPNRYADQDSIVFIPNTEDYSYSIRDLTRFFNGKELSKLVLINPDNPSGNYITKAEVVQLLDWCRCEEVRLILDESFADFSEEKDNTFLNNELLECYPNLVVIKSISKSHGVPGVRLGVLASANSELVARIKKDVAIWNINSFGEFYLQIVEKYKNDYEHGLKQFRESRKTLVQGLSKFSKLRIIPSHANFLMMEILGGTSSTEVTKRLLSDFNLFVKDLSNKKINYKGRQYIRVAIRGKEDNAALITALAEVLA